MKRLLIILVALALIILLSWGHIAIWHNWSWVNYIPGSAWLGTILYAVVIGFIGAFGTADCAPGIKYANAAAVAIICAVAQYIAFSPSFLTDGGFWDWVGLIAIIGLGAILSFAFASGNKDLIDGLSGK